MLRSRASLLLVGRGPLLLTGSVRSLAILIQNPQFSYADMAKERALRKKAEVAAMRQRNAVAVAVVAPQFRTFKEASTVLDLYEEHRPLLAPRDAVGAFVAIGQMAKSRDMKTRNQALASYQRMSLLRTDIALCAGHLYMKDVCNVLIASSWLGLESESMASPQTTTAHTRVRTYDSGHR